MLKRKVAFDTGLLSKHRGFLFGVGTLLIAATHLSTKFPKVGIWIIPYLLKSYGMIGVDIFLLISGFGLYGSLKRRYDVCGFYKRRFVRLCVPAFIVAALYGAVTDMSLSDYVGGITSLAFFWNGKAFWYVTFMIIVYALYPFMFAVQQKSQKNAVVLSAVVSLIAVTVSFTCDLPDYNLRAISRIPLFMLGYICSPLINEERKIPVWPVLTSAIVFVGLELLRMRCMPENYGMRSLTFIPLTIVLVVFISFIAELLARLRAVHWLYRLIDFFGMISLEMYLLFSTVRDLLKRCTGAELQTMTDVAKLDISAFLVAALLGYLLTIFIKRLTDSFCSIHIPEETNT